VCDSFHWFAVAIDWENLTLGIYDPLPQPGSSEKEKVLDLSRSRYSTRDSPLKTLHLVGLSQKDGRSCGVYVAWFFFTDMQARWKSLIGPSFI